MSLPTEMLHIVVVELALRSCLPMRAGRASFRCRSRSRSADDPRAAGHDPRAPGAGGVSAVLRVDGVAVLPTRSAETRAADPATVVNVIIFHFLRGALCCALGNLANKLPGQSTLNWSNVGNIR
jgi:hypothetical protein